MNWKKVIVAVGLIILGIILYYSTIWVTYIFKGIPIILFILIGIIIHSILSIFYVIKDYSKNYLMAMVVIFILCLSLFFISFPKCDFNNGEDTYICDCYGLKKTITYLEFNAASTECIGYRSKCYKIDVDIDEEVESLIERSQAGENLGNYDVPKVEVDCDIFAEAQDILEVTLKEKTKWDKISKGECNSIEDPLDKAICLREKAIILDDPGICYDIDLNITNSYYLDENVREDCFSKTVFNKCYYKDGDYSSEEEYDNCLLEIGKQFKDLEICDSFKDDASRASCYDGVFIAIKDSINTDYLRQTITESLNLNQNFQVVLEYNELAIEYDIFINDTLKNKLIYAEKYCNLDSDCKSWGNQGSCINTNFEKHDKTLSDQKNLLEESGFKQDNQCLCYNNKCFYDGEPYNWINSNLEKDSNIMMWWDFGDWIEAAGMNPIVKGPSESIMDTVSGCAYPNSLSCLEAQKNLESDEEIKDVSDFFTSEDMNESLCIAYKYDIDYVFIDSSMIHKYYVISHTSNILGDISDEWEILKIPSNIDEADSMFAKLYYFEGEGINYVEMIYYYINQWQNEFYGDKSYIFKVNYPNNIEEIC